MKSRLAVCVLSLALATPALAQNTRPLASTLGLPFLYLGAATVALAPLAGGGAAISSYVVGYAIAGVGSYAVVWGLTGLTQEAMAAHRGVAQEEALKDELKGLMHDLEAGRVLGVDDVAQTNWRSYLNDLAHDQELSQRILQETSGDASFEQKLIAAAIVDLMKR